MVVAEDDPVSLEILASILTKWGFHVIATTDGREAMEALRAQNEPVLAIIDWMMPGLEGPEVCRRAREANRLVYILMLTARVGKDRIVEALEAGADDYLSKPFDNAELQARLNVGLRIIDLQASLRARIIDLEGLVKENRDLKLRIPL